MQESPQDPVELAEATLHNNDHGSYTIPAAGLYPHQWLWDSCFIAIGLRHIDLDRAQLELQSLLRGQWSNGMLPHMIFAGDAWYNRDRNIWRSHLSPFSPDDISTSGLTQPPMLAEAVVRTGDKLSTTDRRTWYQTMFPALLKHHLWMYADRSTGDNDLLGLIHPYESGLDNSPPWIDQLRRHHWPWWAWLLERTPLENMVTYFRRDTRHVPPGQRMSNLEALLYYHSLIKTRNKRYNASKILSSNMFVVDDLAFNCIAIRANTHLQHIAKTIRKELPNELLNSMSANETALEELWDGYKGQYFSRNHHTKKLIRQPTIATLLPLYSGVISKERAEQLVALLRNRHVFGANYPVPSVPFNSSYYKPLGYWQGPTWLNTNWLIIDGLERYGFTKEASIIRAKSIELVKNSGCYEYFSAVDGRPAGAKDFSWTAALTIDLLSDYSSTRKKPSRTPQ